ncbi:HAD-IA family hydrolase [Yunchengibacter salinarum]|uniref:HAD-IA family hydrolase n=1 Tax=Yunchengibacter salinarum TaxID=3133399 RepID=UPI0035B5D30D
MPHTPPFPARIILLDLDGTLVDTAPDLHRATNHVLESLDRPPVSLDQTRHMVGQGARKLIELGLKATGGDSDIGMETLLDRFLTFYGAHLSEASTPYPGAHTLLGDLAQAGYWPAVCTNKPEGLARRLLAELELDRHIRTLSGGDSFTFRKPDPRHLSETARRLGPDPFLLVGDSISDTRAATAANVPCIVVRHGYSDRPPEELGGSCLVAHLADIPALLRPVG